MALDDPAARLTTAGAELAAAAAALPAADPGATAFGAHGTGRLGGLGRELHGRLVAALDGGAREGRGHGARFVAAADAVRQAAAGYTTADEAAAARLRAGH